MLKLLASTFESPESSLQRQLSLLVISTLQLYRDVLSEHRPERCNNIPEFTSTVARITKRFVLTSPLVRAGITFGLTLRDVVAPLLTVQAEHFGAVAEERVRVGGVAAAAGPVLTGKLLLLQAGI